MEYDEDNQVVEDLSSNGKTPDEGTTITAMELSAIAEGAAGRAIAAAGKLKELVLFLETLAADVSSTLAVVVALLKVKTLEWHDSQLLDEDIVDDNITNIQWDTYCHTDVVGINELLQKAHGSIQELSNLHEALVVSVSRDLEDLGELHFSIASSPFQPRWEE